MMVPPPRPNSAGAMPVCTLNSLMESMGGLIAKLFRPFLLVVDSIDLIIVLLRALAGRCGNRRVAGHFRRAKVGGGGYGHRREKSQLHELPHIQREIIHLLVLDHLASLRSFR